MSLCGKLGYAILAISKFNNFNHFFRACKWLAIITPLYFQYHYLQETMECY